MLCEQGVELTLGWDILNILPSQSCDQMKYLICARDFYPAEGRLNSDIMSFLELGP